MLLNPNCLKPLKSAAFLNLKYTEFTNVFLQFFFPDQLHQVHPNAISHDSLKIFDNVRLITPILFWRLSTGVLLDVPYVSETEIHIQKVSTLVMYSGSPRLKSRTGHLQINAGKIH
jgi:hypothetical protein